MKFDSSSAKRRPIIVTRRADSLRVGGIVRICVLVGVMLRVMSRPARMLP